jgi:hypothetical protein
LQRFLKERPPPPPKKINLQYCYKMSASKVVIAQYFKQNILNKILYVLRKFG